MDIKTFGLTTSEASDLSETWLNDGRKIDFLAVHHRAGSMTSQIWNQFGQTCGAVHGATSCQGIMTGNGIADIGIFAISDPFGNYGTAAAELGTDTREAAKRATRSAMIRAQREGEMPDLIWVSITPGTEEDAIRGIEDVVGDNVPIIGGSAADDTVSGNWRVSEGHGEIGSGLVVSVLFCSSQVHFAYQNGYEPTQYCGTVTKSKDRKILEIDNRPAAQVYDEWSQGDVPRATDDSVNILSEATLWPLGRQISVVGDVPYHLLAHPCASNPDGSIDLFAEVSEGEVLTQMKGDRDALAARAGRVAEFALKTGHIEAEDISGALMVYCGGCMLAVQDRLEQVYTGVNAALQNQPYLGIFTFGEQGTVHKAGNRHGNLMISCIAFEK